MKMMTNFIEVYFYGITFSFFTVAKFQKWSRLIPLNIKGISIHSLCISVKHSQIGYSQSASLLAHNLIAAIAAFPWESALPRKQGSPTHRFRLGGLEAGDFLDEVK